MLWTACFATLGHAVLMQHCRHALGALRPVGLHGLSTASGPPAASQARGSSLSPTVPSLCRCSVTVVSSAFEGKNSVARHRMVYQLLQVQRCRARGLVREQDRPSRGATVPWWRAGGRQGWVPVPARPVAVQSEQASGARKQALHAP